jgi:hypothetical protein
MASALHCCVLPLVAGSCGCVGVVRRLIRAVTPSETRAACTGPVGRHLHVALASCGGGSCRSAPVGDSSSSAAWCGRCFGVPSQRCARLRLQGRSAQQDARRSHPAGGQMSEIQASAGQATQAHEGRPAAFMTRTAAGGTGL